MIFARSTSNGHTAQETVDSIHLEWLEVAFYLQYFISFVYIS